MLGTETRIPTLLYNGYGEYVAHLYAEMIGETLYRYELTRVLWFASAERSRLTNISRSLLEFE